MRWKQNKKTVAIGKFSESILTALQVKKVRGYGNILFTS